MIEPTTTRNGSGGAVAIDEHAPVADIEKMIPDDFLAYLDSIGSKRDASRWEIGDVCVLLIDSHHLPAMQVYQIVGKRVDYGLERVRKLCATSRYYNTETRQCYENLHHSVFEYARTCAEPEQVLQLALEGQQTLTVVKNTTRPLIQDLQETYARIPRDKRDEANTIIKMALAKLRELSE